MPNRRKAPWKRALLGVAALAGLLNLTACLRSAMPPLVPVITYSPDYQRAAAAELRELADPGNACYAPHVLGLVLDYAKTRGALRAANGDVKLPDHAPEPATPKIRGTIES